MSDQSRWIESLEHRTYFSAHATAAAPRSFGHTTTLSSSSKRTRATATSSATVPAAARLAESWVRSPSADSNHGALYQLTRRNGALFTDFSAETHPSQGNYLALFSGSPQGVTSDAPPARPFTATSLGGQIIASGHTFVGYSEGLPAAGSTVTRSGDYSRSHNPWSDFADVPAASNQPFSAFPSRDFSRLPTVSFVIPNNSNNMHSGSIRRADDWLRSNLGDYAKWAATHNSLLVVTWDEGRGNNHIATIFYGAGVKRGAISQSASHYNLLRTIEDIYSLTPLGNAAGSGVSDLAAFS